MSEFVRSLTFLRPTSDPLKWTAGRKRLILFICGASAATGGFTSTVYLPSLPAIRLDLNAPETEVNLTMSLFILFSGLGPVLSASISDSYRTRRAVYVIALSLFVLVSALGYVAPNVGTLVVIRILQSLLGTAPMATAYGTVSDLYAPENRGGALGFVSSMATVGPLVGPILGGFIATAWGWRATFLATASLGGLFLILHMLFGAETFRDVKRWDGGAADSVETDGDEGIAVDALRSSGEGAGTEVDYSEIPKGECRQLVVETESDATGVSTTAANKKQLHPLLVVFRLLGVDFVLFTSLCAAVGFSVMFAIQTIMPILFLEVYDFNASQTGLSYLAGGFMNAVSALVAGRTSDYFYKRARQQRMKRARGAQLESATGNENEHGMPEDRFTPWTFVNSFFIVPFGTILFGWSIYARVHIGVPIAAFGFVCFGFTDSVLTSSAYLVDATAAYGRASSATSAANLFRMVLACVLSVIATPWVRAIGVQWLCTLFAGLSVLSGLGLLGLKWAGPKMRARSSSVFAKSSNPKQ